MDRFLVNSILPAGTLPRKDTYAAAPFLSSSPLHVKPCAVAATRSLWAALQATDLMCMHLHILINESELFFSFSLR